MNGTYKVFGGNRLEGTVTPIPNKNSLMGAIPIVVLAQNGLEILDMPKTHDVAGYLEILESIGVRHRQNGKTTVFDSTGISTHRILSERGRQFRGSFSLAGPLLARFGEAVLPIPGGCKLGYRSIATHVTAFRELGVRAEETGDVVSLSLPRGWGCRHMVWLSEASVTTTINIASFAAGTNAEIEIRNAACEPHVRDVLLLLQKMGARIDGIGSNHLFVGGTDELRHAVFQATPDFVDVAGYCVAAGVTKGRIVVRGGNTNDDMAGILKRLSYFGLDISLDGDDVTIDGERGLEIQAEKFPKAGHELPKLAVAPWPGFPVDVLPVMVTLATKAAGRILFQNWMYESGFDFTRELMYMGADIYICDPQRIIVLEPKTTYTGGVVGSPGIIQGTKAIFLAALADPVETTIHGTEILMRRYPDILETYKKLGAEITAVTD